MASEAGAPELRPRMIAAIEEAFTLDLLDGLTGGWITPREAAERLAESVIRALE